MRIKQCCPLYLYITMKIILLTLSLSFISHFAFTQAPEVEWQNTIGGDLSDVLQSIQQTTDGGYVLGGTSYSNNVGDKAESSLGADDYWIVKTDNYGVIQWQNTIGGSDQDRLYSIEQTGDGGYILGGYSASPASGDKSESTIGNNDYWVIKIDSLGNIQWQNNIAGLYDDLLYKIHPTIDGYILAGSSSSNISGDKTENSNGSYDYWVIKLDLIGNIVWQNTIGGNLDDGQNTIDIKQTSDGGYILGGSSNSVISGDKTENNNGGYDYWIIKLDNAGTIQWQNTIGGDNNDYLTSIIQTFDGGYFVGGFSYSNISGDKTEATIGLVGAGDYWVIKLTSLGDIEWQNTIGGDDNDNLSCVKQTYDGGYVLAGYSASEISGDKTEPKIWNSDYWVIKLGTTGNIQWQNTIGGNSFDNLNCIIQTTDGGFILGGDSSSPISVDKTEANNGANDYWIVKLYPEDCTPITFYEDADGDGFGTNLISTDACFTPVGYVLDNTDCNDTNNTINPSMIEICNAIDDNCNFTSDEGMPLNTYYLDIDNDGYGNILYTTLTCSDLPPTGYVINNSDCDDTNMLIHEPILYYADLDADLYGDGLNLDYFCTIIPPTGYAINNFDCNDLNNLINPLSNEMCNNIDDNCNTIIDEGLPTQILYIDADEDNFGNHLIDTITCFFEIAGYVINNADCDDTNPFIYPGSPEILDGIDNNCNEVIDEGFNTVEDLSDSVFSIYPNPANNLIILAITNQINTNTPLCCSIADMTGKIVLQFYITSDKKVLDVSNFASGVYIVKVVVGDFSFVQKLVIN